jgi:hypothetical protein
MLANLLFVCVFNQIVFYWKYKDKILLKQVELQSQVIKEY